MNLPDLFSALIASSSPSEVESAIADFESQHTNRFAWVPFGRRENNRGTIEGSADPGRSLVERLTNAIDAVLEDEHEDHGGVPDCRTPKEAASAWLNVPDGGLSEMTPAQRRSIAQRVSMLVTSGESRSSRVVEIRDIGIGLTPAEMPSTILSLNESNKVQKHYLAGAYGQGGSSTLATSRYTVIASRREGSPTVGFTVACYQDLPPDLFKIGRYVYATLDGIVMALDIPFELFAAGTLIRHVGYDLTSYPSPLGPNSIYGLLNQALFDPVLPVWLDDYEIHGYRRVIKGSRNALNGAVDEGDAARRGPDLSHNMRMFYTNIADFGRIGIEYWVLERPTAENKKPSAAFVNPAKPIILTLNGQNHAELPGTLIRKDAELSYLSQRLICHIDSNHLSPAAKRSLFVSNREDARRGVVLDLIRQELIRALRSDDELVRLNNEARNQGQQERDQAAVQQMRAEVARLLRIQGIDVGPNAAPTPDRAGAAHDRPAGPRRPPRRPLPLELHEPPTYIRILWEEDRPIDFYPEQRRYIRIETDANSTYHDPSNAAVSRINIFAVGDAVTFHGSTHLQGGRMRAVFQAGLAAPVGSTGTIAVELSTPGLPALTDQRNFRVVETPPARQAHQRLSLPPFRLQPVEGPEDMRWSDLGWPDNYRLVASSSEMEEGTLVIYYSTAFPKFADQHALLERRDATLAASFVTRYEIWLAVHSLLLYRDQQEASAGKQSTETDLEAEEARERDERCRLATMASLIAVRELHAAQDPADPE